MMSELRLVHTADAHLGHSSQAFGTTAPEHRRRLQEAFGCCVDLCVERTAQLFIIAGDLFDSPQPPESAASFVLAQLSRLSAAWPPVHCVILPGTHDLLKPGSIYTRWLAEGLPQRVHLLTPQQPRVDLSECNTTVFGPVPDHPHRPLQGLQPEPRAHLNIAVAHGSVQIPGVVEDDETLITEQDIADCGMDYVALGHWHRFSDHSVGGVTALYSGSPEIVALDQATRGQALVVDLNAEGRVHWEQVPTGSLHYEQHQINLADFASEDAILQALLAQAHPDRILDIHLTGLAPAGLIIDAERLAEQLADSFFRVRVLDESHLALATVDESQYPPQLVTGRFVRLMKERIQAAQQQGDEAAQRVAEQALQIGLALLAGREVLG